MVVRSLLVAGALALIISIPPVGAQSVAPSDLPPPVYRTSAIPQGTLTRGQFIDALASRLFSTAEHASCFRDLVGADAPSFTLLFSDVSINQPIATSVCVMMKSSLVRGSSNYLNPNQRITAAEVAAVFSRLAAVIPNPIPHEPWYQRYMKIMRSIDPGFTFQPWDSINGTQIRDMLCTLKRVTPQLDPNGELAGC